MKRTNLFLFAIAAAIACLFDASASQAAGLAVVGAVCALDVVAVAPVQGFHQSPGAAGLAFCAHTFRASPDGQLEHLTDGRLRAIVPPEGWAGYLEQWPQAQSVVDSLRKPTEKPSAPAVVGAAVEGVKAVRDRKQKRLKGQRVAGRVGKGKANG